MMKMNEDSKKIATYFGCNKETSGINPNVSVTGPKQGDLQASTLTSTPIFRG